MRCKKCKSKIAKDGKFCPACGEPVKKRKKWPVVLVLVILVIAVMGFLLAFAVFGADNIEEERNAENVYSFKENIINEFDAAASANVPTAQQAIEELSNRGFVGVELTTSYELDGSFFEEHGLDASSQEKHPLYNAFYLAPNEKLWVIYVCNGSYMANPLFVYEMGKPQMLLIEDDYVTSYKSSTNTFMQTIPDENELQVVKVERVDAETLNGFDEKTIKGQE